MDKEELKSRTKNFSLRVVKLIDALPSKVSAKVIANQLARSAMSVAANYRAACRARSRAEFISKIGTVLEEADECQYWLEMIMEAGLLKKSLVISLYKEANELTAIFSSTLKSSKKS
jgi:four helix bundle protein